jgi:hypothetical protein
MLGFSVIIFVLSCVNLRILHCHQHTSTPSNLFSTSSEVGFVSGCLSASAVVSSRVLKGFRLSCNGTFTSFENVKDHLAKELSISLRDLRIVDPSYPSQIQAEIVPRNHVILFSIENVKMIITNEDVYIFGTNRQVYDEEQISVVLNLLKNQITSLESEAVSDVSFATDPLSSVPTSTHQEQFSHNILESVLGFICNNLASTVHRLETSILSALADLRDSSKGLNVLQMQIDILLPLKNQFNDLDKRCAEIKQCLNDILDDDETLQQFYLDQPLSKKPAISKQQLLKNPFNKKGDSGYRTNKIRSKTKIRKIKKLNRRGTLSVTKKTNVQTLSSSGINKPCFLGQRQLLSDNNRDFDTISLEILLENYLHEIEWISSEITHHLD